MYKLTQKFTIVSVATGMAVSANRDKYKTYQFKKKPSKEEIKKIILGDIKLITNLHLPKPTSYLLSKNNETLYRFDIDGCMIENHKFKELIKKIKEKDIDLGVCFETSVKFISFENGVLKWESCPDEDCKEQFKRFFSPVIRPLINEIFGMGTKIEPIRCEKKNENIEFKKIKKDWKKLSEEHELDIEVVGIPPLATFKFNYRNYLELHTLFTQEMLKRGYFASKSVYVSYTHTEDVVEKYMENVDEVFRIIKKGLEENKIKELLKCPVAYEGFKRLN